jgi:hypothetical protein
MNRPVSAPNPANAVSSYGTNTLNQDGIIFPSASRTAAAYTSAPIANPDAKGIRLFVANDGAGGSTATAKVQVQDPLSKVWVDLAGATSAAVGASTGTITTVYPGLTGIADAAGVTVNQHIGPLWRVVLTIGVATGVSSVGADYLL